MSTQAIVFLVILAVFIFSRITEALEEAKRRAAETRMMGESRADNTDWEELRRRALAERANAEARKQAGSDAAPASSLPTFAPASSSRQAAPSYRPATATNTEEEAWQDGETGDTFGNRRLEERRNANPIFTMLDQSEAESADVEEEDAADRQAELFRKLARARERAEQAKQLMAQQTRRAAASAQMHTDIHSTAAARSATMAQNRIGSTRSTMLRLGRLPAADARVALAASEIMRPKWMDY